MPHACNNMKGMLSWHISEARPQCQTKKAGSAYEAAPLHTPTRTRQAHVVAHAAHIMYRHFKMFEQDLSRTRWPLRRAPLRSLQRTHHRRLVSRARARALGRGCGRASVCALRGLLCREHSRSAIALPQPGRAVRARMTCNGAKFCAVYPS